MKVYIDGDEQVGVLKSISLPKTDKNPAELGSFMGFHPYGTLEPFKPQLGLGMRKDSPNDTDDVARLIIKPS